MTDFKGIRGWKVQTLSTDPAASQGAGGTWASGGDMNTARIASTGTSASSTNSIIGGGYYLPPTVNRSVTEAYDGTSWSELSDHPVSIVYGNGLGVKTAALIAGIDVSASPTNSSTYIFDGSSWSAPGASINTMKFFGATGGTTTAGIIAGGNTPPATATTEIWNGSTWTETTDLNTAKTNLGGGTGTSTALMAVGGTPATIEVYDGSSWTEIAEMNTSRSNSSKGGIVTAAIVTNGYSGPNYPGQTELYDGTSWTEVGDTPISVGYASNISSGQPGGQTDAVLAGGQTSTTFSATTLEWSAPSTFQQLNLGQVYFNSTANAFKVTEQPVPGGTWSSGGTLNTPRFAGSAAGTQTANLYYAGGNPQTNKTESYNGTSWTEVNDLNAAGVYACGGGTQTAAIRAGGENPTVTVDLTETWDGTNWTEVAEINTAKSGANGFGTLTDFYMCGGGFPGSPGRTAQVENWNGSSWTETTDLNNQRTGPGGVGTPNAGLITGGTVAAVIASNESWNGTAWTELNDINTARSNGGSSGLLTSALYYGGVPSSPGYSALNEIWDGTSWTEGNDLSTSRGYTYGSPIGSAVAALYTGGLTPPQTGVTEEYDVALSNKTITVS